MFLVAIGTALKGPLAKRYFGATCFCDRFCNHTRHVLKANSLKFKRVSLPIMDRLTPNDYQAFFAVFGEARLLA